MEFNFQQILDQLNAGNPQSNFSWAIARGAVTPADYVFNSILPDVNRPTFDVQGGQLTFTPTMLQGVPMDDKFPPFGAMSSSTFFENTTKFGGSMFFTEKQLRELYQFEANIRQSMALLGGDVSGSIMINPVTGRGEDNTVNGRRLNAILDLQNFIMKAHWDTREYLKGKALNYGAISGTDFAFMGVTLDVDYNVPSANKFATRSGNDRYGGSTSKFWTDIRAVSRILSNWSLWMNSNTWYSIIDQPANNIVVTADEMLSAYRSTKRITKIDTTKVTQNIDKRDMATINVYDRSGSVLKADTTNPALQAIPFQPDGKIFIVGDLRPEGFTLTQGATLDPNLDLDFGYNHVAPTVEGGFTSGIWSRIYTPEAKPMNLMLETAVNQLPVIMNPKKLVILTTDLS